MAAGFVYQIRRLYPVLLGDFMNQAKRREELYGLMGELPERDRAVCGRLIREEVRGGYRLEHLELDLNGMEKVPALFARPAGTMGKLPTIVFNHSHGGRYKVGKMELLESAPYMQARPWVEDLTAQGYNVLAIDHWCFGERSTRTEGAMFRETLWKGQVMWGMMVYDSLKAVDYLMSRGDVDGGRIGTIGMSMGSTMGWWLAALDERIKVCVDICCLTDFEALIQEKGLEGHGVYYYVPRLMKHFTAGQINALIAPRAHLGIEGEKDTLTPLEGMRKIDRELQQVYAAMGAKEKWKLSLYPVPHQETPEARKEALAFLKQWL